MTRPIHCATAVILLGIASNGAAQVERFDLGQKLRVFEMAWDEQTDVTARRRAMPELKKVVPLFFAGRLAEVAQMLDRTRFLLKSGEEAPAADRWAASLVSRPHVRLLDPMEGPLQIEVRALYDSRVDRPDKATVICTLLPAEKAGVNAITEPIGVLPHRVAVPTWQLPEGDYTLRTVIAVDGRTLATHESTISVSTRLSERLKAVALAAAEVGDPHTERLTFRALVEQLQTLADRKVYETNLPASRMIAGAEALAKAVKSPDPYYIPRRSGQFWLTLATDSGPAPVRLLVPTGLTKIRPVPLVVALHGMGGSENLFFDGYGYGAIARLCIDRGWLLVATRADGFGKVPPVAGIVSELARRYPIDLKRVFLVGHSMGASHAIDIVQSMPGRIAAVAALGGGGTVRQPQAVKNVPIFVGCGAEDFALGWAKTLAQTLEMAGAKVHWKEYPDVEHMVIVQEALKDVFAYFEKKGKGP